MANNTDAAQVSNDPDVPNFVSTTVERQVITSHDDDVRALHDAVRALPSHAVKDLLSIGVCARCIFRLFGIRELIYSCSSAAPSILNSVVGAPTDLDKDIVNSGFREHKDSTSPSTYKNSEVEAILCRLCFGILQFIYSNDKEMLVKKESGNDLAVSISALVGDMAQLGISESFKVKQAILLSATEVGAH